MSNFDNNKQQTKQLIQNILNINSNDNDSKEDFIHQFMNTVLNNHRDRLFLFKIDNLVYDVVFKENKKELKFTNLNSYYRLIVHQVANLYNMDHSYNKQTQELVLTKKLDHAYKIPKYRFIDLMDKTYSFDNATTANNNNNKILNNSKYTLLKKNNYNNNQTNNNNLTILNPNPNTPVNSNNPLKEIKSVQERELEYEIARQRIFMTSDNNHKSNYHHSPTPKNHNNNSINNINKDDLLWNNYYPYQSINTPMDNNNILWNNNNDTLNNLEESNEYKRNTNKTNKSLYDPNKQTNK